VEFLTTPHSYRRDAFLLWWYPSHRQKGFKISFCNNKNQFLCSAFQARFLSKFHLDSVYHWGITFLKKDPSNSDSSLLKKWGYNLQKGIMGLGVYWKRLNWKKIEGKPWTLSILGTMRPFLHRSPKSTARNSVWQILQLHLQYFEFYRSLSNSILKSGLLIKQPLGITKPQSSCIFNSSEIEKWSSQLFECR